MIGTEILMDAFRDRKLVPPLSSARANLVDLAQAVGKLAGVCSFEPTARAKTLADSIGESDHLVLVLIDGFGMVMVDSLPEGAFMRRHVQEEMRTVFPSTTAVALTTLTTGRWPAAHGVTAWWTHLPDLGSAANTLQYTARAGNRDLLERGIDPKRSFPVPSMWAGIPRDAALVIPQEITDSVYSGYFSGGRRAIGYDSVRAGVDAVIERVNNASEKTFTYFYISQVDSLAHRQGWERPEVLRAMREMDTHMARLRSELGSNARMVVTADHGFMDAEPRNRHSLKLTRQIQPLLRVAPSGDARVIYLHTLSWAKERVRRYLEPRFGERFVVVDTEDAIAIGLFGPDDIEEDVRERFGDMMIISMGADVLEYNPGRGPGRMLLLNGHHSGLSPEEMEIPLIVA